MWASPGPYLQKSIFVTLAQSVSGHDLPPPLIENGTFEDNQNLSGGEAADLGSLYAFHIRRAAVNTLREHSSEDDSRVLSESEEVSQDKPVFEDAVDWF